MRYLFKKGDEVRLIKNKNMAADIGSKAIVTKDFKKRDTYLYVKWIGDAQGQSNGDYIPNYFEPIKITNWKERIK